MGSARAGSNPAVVAALLIHVFSFLVCELIGVFIPTNFIVSLAEWSKALRLGRSPQGRGFEPHCCYVSLTINVFFIIQSNLVREGLASKPTAVTCYYAIRIDVFQYTIGCDIF